MTAASLQQSVLAIEDNAPLRELYRSALRAVGYAVVAVDDGPEALCRMERTLPDAVVLDLALPRLSGRDVHRDLKAHPETHDIPIIVVSGTDTSDLDPNDFACVLRKPTPSPLVQILKYARDRERGSEDSRYGRLAGGRTRIARVGNYAQ